MSAKTGEAWLQSNQKRAMDITMAGAIAPVVAPVVLLAAGVVAAAEREAPFITQARPGRDSELIKIRKLRTMPHGTEETMSNGHYDERRTKIGRFLSLTRVDEMPQLANVLKGEMSMVGLRPLVATHREQFMDSLAGKTKQQVARAYTVARPGWFDPYGVNLYVMGAEDTHEARAESIIRYVGEASAKRDFQIILQALGIVRNIVGDTGVDLLPDHNPEPATHPDDKGFEQIG